MRNRVAQVLLKGFEDTALYFQEKIHFEIVPLNGETGILLRTGDEIVAAIFIQPRRGKIARIYAVRNPDKLTRILVVERGCGFRLNDDRRLQIYHKKSTIRCLV